MNAFTIPDKSSIIENNRALFPKKVKPNQKLMKPLTLPGSSPYPKPKLMRKVSNENAGGN